MRFKLNPLAPNGISLDEEPKLIKSGGYAGSPDITRVIQPGTNVTFTGSGTQQSPYIVNSSGGGSPGGSDTQVQYNAAGSFAGDTGLTYDSTNKRLNIGQPLNTAVTTGSPALVLSGGKLTKGLVLQQSATAGTFNMLELQRSDAGLSAWFDSGAVLRMATNAGVGLVATNSGTTFSGAITNAQVQIQAANTGSIGLSVLGSGAQTADLFTLHSSAGTKLTTFDAAGMLNLIGTSAGFANYNVGDPAATNYERVRQFWASNLYSTTAEAGGTGVVRNMLFASGTTTMTFSQNNNTKFALVLTTNASTAPSYSLTASLQASAVQQIAQSKTFTYTQTGTAGYTSLLVNSVETSTGSGTKLALDLQTNSTSIFNVTSTGVATVGNTLTVTNATALRGGFRIARNNTAITTSTALGGGSMPVQDVDATSGAINITPPNTTGDGFFFTITKIDASANAVTLVGTYNGQVNPTLATQWKYMTFVTTNVAGVFRTISNN